MKTILSYGMGVESTAILLRWMLEPETCPCELDKLIVITSQVGNEWPDTGRDVQTHILPMMRERGVRFVQVARAGHNEKDGITVLDDTRSPERCFMEGDYTLAEELRDAGTVPQYSGTHRCALKFKSFVVDAWLDAGGDPDGEKVAFGFNTNEMDRVKKGQTYDTAQRTSFFPLLEWGWDRQNCIDYIKSIFGVVWKKSACVFCPFSCNKQSADDLAARQADFPEEVADAMMLEHLSISLNPGGVLYSNKALRDFVAERNNNAAIEAFQRKLASVPWTIYRVRRLWKGMATADRAVEKQGSFAGRKEAERALRAEAMGAVATLRDITYDFVRPRDKTQFPSKEEYFVASPSVVETKARYGIPKFDGRWNNQQISLLNQPEAG